MFHALTNTLLFTSVVKVSGVSRVSTFVQPTSIWQGYRIMEKALPLDIRPWWSGDYALHDVYRAGGEGNTSDKMPSSHCVPQRFFSLQLKVFFVKFPLQIL